MKKTIIVAAAAAGAVAAAVPAMALENEFHGMYKFMGYQGNFFDGQSPKLYADAHSGFFAEQRARIQYTAKANDNLKLVTHFELDSRFGGKNTSSGYLKTQSGNDAGQLDADSLTLETKNIYLDFNCPITGANVKVGIQPWVDSYNALFLLADTAGISASKKFGDVTATLAWFRPYDTTNGDGRGPGQFTTDLIVLDGKFALNKDMKVGGSYYNIQDDASKLSYELLHVLGLNADLTFGPATVKPFFLYEFGDYNANNDISAFAFGATGKVKVANGAVNLAAFYLSGDKDGCATNDCDAYQVVAAGYTYFNPANMWLLIRSGQAINSSTSILSNDITVGGRGSLGLFAGYEGKVDKMFYNANIGYMMANKERGTEDAGIGTEINAQVGYKMFDNLSVSAAAAYAMLGDGMSKAGKTIAGKGVAGADDPYMLNVQLSYSF
ncbi:MAG: membrane protein [Desulfuromonadia bacterium]